MADGDNFYESSLITGLDATANRVFYSDTSGDIQEVALGAAGTHLISAGTTSAPAFGVHLHDGDTLQLDGINSNGGAFSFTTSGAVTFSQGVNLSNELDITGTNIQIDVNQTATSNISMLNMRATEGLSMGINNFHHSAVIINTRSGGTGERETLTVHQIFSGAVTGSNNVASFGLAHCTGDSGTAFGMNAVAWTDPGVDDDASCIGMEINTRQERTGNVYQKIGLNIIDIAGVTSDGNASSLSAGIRIGKTGTSDGYDSAIHVTERNTYTLSEANPMIFNVPTGDDYFWKVNGSNIGSFTAEGDLTITRTYAGPGDNSAARFRTRDNIDVQFYYETDGNRFHIYKSGVGYLGYTALTAGDDP